MPEHRDACTFDGTSSGVRVAGVGPAVLTRRGAFSGGAASRVELRSAQIAGDWRDAIDQPDALTPVNDNGDGEPYDVAYTVQHTGSLEIRIHEGGHTGYYVGELAGGGCEARGCDVVWGHGAKVIVLHFDAQRELTLTSSFPFGALLEGEQKAHVARLQLDLARGTLTCDGESRLVDGQTLAYDASNQVRSAPLILQRGRLRTNVKSDGAPAVANLEASDVSKAPSGELNVTAVHHQDAPAASSEGEWWGALAAGLVLGLGIAALALRHIRARRGRAQPPAPTAAGCRVFLSYNRADLAEVRELAAAMEQRDCPTFLDERALVPGQPWVRELEAQIATAPAAAVLIGTHGVGEWQQREIEALLEQQRKRGCLVVPVLLRSAPADSQVPIFLSTLQWVDLRKGYDDALRNLVAALADRLRR